MRTYKARGIVLHTIKYGDTGLVAYILTDVLGRQSYMVQGVRSSRGHGNKAALLQPMFALEFEGIESPRAGMHRIREMRAAIPFRSLPFDVRKSTVALFMAELLYRLVREVEPSSPLFDFVWEAVGALDATEQAADVANFHLGFMVGLSRHLGFFPGGEWLPGSWFDIREGIFTPVRPRHDHFFSRENSELLSVFMDALDPAPVSAPASVPSPALVSALSSAPAPNPVLAPTSVSASASAPSPPFITARAPVQPLTPPLNRARRVDFLNSMLAYFDYHLEAVRDIRSVDILREVF